jgi:hypothetical protein
MGLKGLVLAFVDGVDCATHCPLPRSGVRYWAGTGWARETYRSEVVFVVVNFLALQGKDPFMVASLSKPGHVARTRG